ncbi:FHA domain-containing protein [Georgenia sp. Z1491]|uniref:FHA domain-containing protein n=1 Tax=Georgenia sp. Z1491 TaxID=3416707 RepID=UPI003CF33B7E
MSTPPPPAPEPWDDPRLHLEEDGTSADSTARFGMLGEPSADPSLPGLSAEESKAVAALPAGSALMIVQHGPNSGARFLLDAASTSVGRHPRSDIFLDDVTVSRHHCEFLVRDGGVDVRDVGSLNGTYVNRTRIDAVRLRAGDEVQVGKYRLTYHPSQVRGEEAREA